MKRIQKYLEQQYLGYIFTAGGKPMSTCYKVRVLYDDNSEEVLYEIHDSLSKTFIMREKPQIDLEAA